jgi:hypothetical protein
MTVKQWLTRKQDEREGFYIARAGQVAFSVTAFACSIVAMVALTQGRLGDALTALLPACLGFVVSAGLMIYWKALR